MKALDLSMLVRRSAVLVVLAAMALVAARSVHMAITKNLHAPWGGGDFHAYWYYGHFTRLSTGAAAGPAAGGADHL